MINGSRLQAALWIAGLLFMCAPDGACASRKLTSSEIAFRGFLIKLSEGKETNQDWSRVTKHCVHVADCFSRMLRSYSIFFVIDSAPVSHDRGFNRYLNLPFPVVWRIFDRNTPLTVDLCIGPISKYCSYANEQLVGAEIQREAREAGDWNAQYVFIKLHLIEGIEQLFTTTVKYSDQEQVEQIEKWRVPVVEEFKRRLLQKPDSFSDWALKAAIAEALNSIDTAKKRDYPAVWDSDEFKEWYSTHKRY
jgi:hypothetical protein